MNFRHEIKHEINSADALVIRARLGAVASCDSHYENGVYRIRSLYFDDSFDTALREKLDGVNRREKFRIRLYNNSTDFICLEKKSKINGLCAKSSVWLTEREAELLSRGEYLFLKDRMEALCAELFVKMRRGLCPKVLVDYTRRAFVYGPGNVRVTLDYDMETGLKSTELLNPDCPTVPVRDDPKILEVKWDGFLPDIIRDAVNLPFRRESAFSKYATCRMYD